MKYIDPSGHWPSWSQIKQFGSRTISAVKNSFAGKLVRVWATRWNNAVDWYAGEVMISAAEHGIYIPEKMAKASINLPAGYVAGEVVLGGVKNSVKSFKNIRGTGKTWFENATKSSDYLDEAIRRQGLKKAPNSFKEKWYEFGYDFEVRIHPANPEYGKTGSIYRIARRLRGVDANGQGFGWEYMDEVGNWYHKSILKINDAAAEATHIQLH